MIHWYLLLTIATSILSTPMSIDQYDISADLPIYYRICVNGSKYIFTKDHYMNLKKLSSWVPSADTHKVPPSCTQFLGGTTACFLSEIQDRYARYLDLRENLRIHKLFKYIRSHCTST